MGLKKDEGIEETEEMGTCHIFMCLLQEAVFQSNELKRCSQISL